MRNWKSLVTLVLFALAALPAQAQFGIPISDRVIEGNLELPDGSATRFFAREGTMVTVRNEDHDYWYGIILVLDRKAKEPSIRTHVFRLTPVPGDAAHVQEIVADIRNHIGEESLIPADDYSFHLNVSAVHAWKFSQARLLNPRGVDPIVLQKLYGASGGGLCSLTCGAVTVTASGVRMPCGTCEGSR